MVAALGQGHATRMPAMRLTAALRDLRLVSTRATARRGIALGALALSERLLAPATVWALFGSGLASKLGIGLMLSVVFTARTLAQRAWSARVEADLIDRTAASILQADVLSPDVLPGEDARTELVQATYYTSQSLTQTLPNLVSDALACVILATVLVAKEPARLVGLAAGLTVAGAATLAVSRRSVGRAVARVWEVQREVYEAFADALEGRLEIVASGLRAAFLGDLTRRTAAWGAAGIRLASATALSGRLPMLAIAGLVSLALLFHGQTHGVLSVRLEGILSLSRGPGSGRRADGSRSLMERPWRARIRGVERIGQEYAPSAAPFFGHALEGEDRRRRRAARRCRCRRVAVQRRVSPAAALPAAAVRCAPCGPMARTERKRPADHS